MWFGLYLPQWRMSYETILERTLAAERAGWDSVWLMDHLATPGVPGADTLEGWSLAAALAARTTRIRLGHLTTADPLRHPALLAKMVATIDTISNGRVDLGIGWGSVEEELVAFGYGNASKAQRAARLRESLTVVEQMFSGEPFDYDGEFFSLRGACGRPVPAQAHVPIHVGGGGPRLTMPIVATHADWWNCPGYAHARFDELAAMRGSARISLQRVVGLVTSTSDRPEVEAKIARRFSTAGWGPASIGTGHEVAASLRVEADRGVEGFVIQLHDYGRPETIARFGDEVIPALRARAP